MFYSTLPSFPLTPSEIITVDCQLNSALARKASLQDAPPHLPALSAGT